MENFMNLNQLTNIEFLSYFTVEIFCVLAIVLNYSLILFFKKTLNIVKISDIITSSLFLLNSLFLFTIYTTNPHFSLKNDLLLFSNNTILLKIFVNVFAFLFMLIIYKLNRKIRLKVLFSNIILTLIVLFSGILVQSDNFALSYICFEIVIFFIYHYISNNSLKNATALNVQFAAVNLCATSLFIIFYILSFLMQDNLQKSIMLSCLSVCILLKTGIFPIYNYLINKKYKKNIANTILIFSYLTFLGTVIFIKAVLNFGILNEIYQISLCIFLLISMMSFALNLFKTKNIVVFLSNAACLFTGFALLNIVYTNEINSAVKYLIFSSLCTLGLYSLVCILKINFKQNKINIPLIKGIFVKNKKFTFLLSLFLLSLASVLPTGILTNTIHIFKQIYSYDKSGFLIVSFVILYNIFVLLSVIKIIQNCYTLNQDSFDKVMYKKTTFNYVVLYIIVLFLFIGFVL